MFRSKLSFCLIALAVLIQACAPAGNLSALTSPVPSAEASDTSTPDVLYTTECGENSSAVPTNVVASDELEKFEPPDGYTYFGFVYKLWDDPQTDRLWGDARPLEQRLCDAVHKELAEKQPTLIKVQCPWRGGDGELKSFDCLKENMDKVRSILGDNVVFFVEWPSMSEDPAHPITTRDVASGALDSFIRQYARDVRTYGQPLFIRPICGEFNGNWVPWCSPKNNSDLTVTDFVDAWKRIVTIFDEVGVTNVAWVWTPNSPHSPMLEDWEDYYPGDEFVDWVGADTYDYKPPDVIDPIVEFAEQHNKPFFLAEFGFRIEGAETVPSEYVYWLDAMMNYIEAHDQIKAILYFNYKNSPDDPLISDIYEYDGQVSYHPFGNDGDHRLIAGGPGARQFFADHIALPRYISRLWLPETSTPCVPSLLRTCNPPNPQ